MNTTNPQVGSWDVDFYTPGFLSESPDDSTDLEKQAPVLKSGGLISSESDCEKLDCSWFKNTPQWSYDGCRPYCNGFPLFPDEFGTSVRKCRGCPAEFIPESENQWYHTPECKKKTQNQKDRARRLARKQKAEEPPTKSRPLKPRKKRCPVCEIWFQPSLRGQHRKYCSDKCKDVIGYQKIKEKRASSNVV